MAARRLWRRANIDPALCRRLVFNGCQAANSRVEHKKSVGSTLKIKGRVLVGVSPQAAGNWGRIIVAYSAVMLHWTVRAAHVKARVVTNRMIFKI